MQETLNLFPSGAALEALCGWSDNLKTFQQRLGGYYARAEARQAAFDYIQALLCSVERKNGAANVRAGGIRQPLSLSTFVGKSAVRCRTSMCRAEGLCCRAS